MSDSSNAVIAGATVVVRNLETGLTRTLSSDNNGHFSAQVLPVGRYDIVASATSFGNAHYENILLTVGNIVTLNISLLPASNDNTLSVVAEQGKLDLEQSAIGANISVRAISDLPIRGRNFPEFVLLTPSVGQEGDRFGLIFSGQRSINSNIAIDGTDFNNALVGNQRGGNEGTFFFPQAAVREFQVVRAGATAEIGRTNAGFINVVTKSGTNEWHGESFYFNRNSALSSSDAFGQTFDNNQNQFGGAIGGPLKKDRAFIFFATEQNYLNFPVFVKFLPQPLNIKVPAELQALEGEKRVTNNPTALFLRTDINLSTNNLLNLQYSFARLVGDNFNPEATPELAESTNFRREGISNGFKASLTSIFTTTINEVRFQVASDNRDELQNLAMPLITIGDFGRLGGDSGRPRVFDVSRYQVTDDLSVSAGRHQLRFGIDININREQQMRESTLSGRYDFKSLNDYINLKIDRYRQNLAQFDQADLLFHGTQKEFAGYALDKINLRGNIVLTAGFRYEAQLNPQPTRVNPLFPQTQRIPDDLVMLQPRLGLALGLGAQSRTVIRLSAGLFDARTPANLFQRVFTDNGVTSVLVDSKADSNVFKLIKFPNGLQSLPSGIKFAKPDIFGFSADFQNPRSFQSAVEVEQLIGKGLIITATYTHSSTWNLQRRLNRNLFAPKLDKTGLAIFPDERPFANVGKLEINESSAHSSYDALAVAVKRRFSARIELMASYTLSRNRDDDSNERNFSKEFTLNPFDLKSEAALSVQDARHNLVASGLIDLPRGFTVSMILLTHSGLPYTPIIGGDTQNDSNDDNDRAIINGKVAKRNSRRQPYFFDLDLRILKAFSLGESKHLDLFVEAFNVTHNTNKNFGPDAVSVFGTPSKPKKDAGKPLFAPFSARFGGPRQLQLGARFTF